MSTILKFDFQKKKKKQLCFSEVNYQNYTKKAQFCMYVCSIEGLHDAVRTHTRTILSRHLVSFLYGTV